MPQTIEECETCRYWEPPLPVEGVPDTRGAGWAGTCHRYAPRPQASEPYFPNTSAADWCGEWVEAEP